MNDCCEKINDDLVLLAFKNEKLKKKLQDEKDRRLKSKDKRLLVYTKEALRVEKMRHERTKYDLLCANEKLERASEKEISKLNKSLEQCRNENEKLRLYTDDLYAQLESNMQRNSDKSELFKKIEKLENEVKGYKSTNNSLREELLKYKPYRI